ncbi:MAG: D-sedoheptulose 7-phosphate isomerase [Chitinophagales bacterium]|nr:D-sedoheptulose 7-phosphate isomerase [Chitinophagales bacterium]
MQDQIKSIITASIQTKQSILADDKLLSSIHQACDVIVKALKDQKKLLFCGNGGSAADAQHLAAEFTGRFYLERKALPAEALHANTSYLTAVANDYGYNHVYSRLVDGIGHAGDILIALSTSGNSENIIQAIETAKEKDMLTIGFTGESGGKMKDLCDILINIPSKETPRIQESHIMVGHIICQLTESQLMD